MRAEYLAIGEIIKPQGVRGELKIKPLTDDPQRFMDVSSVRLGETEKQIRCTRIGEGFVYARMEGVYSREAADELRGQLLYVHRDDAVKLPEDTEFIIDLVGCRAMDTENIDHGELVEVLQPGGVDVYVFRSEKGDLMVPALKKNVLEVNVIEKRILLDAQGLRETAVYA